MDKPVPENYYLLNKLEINITADRIFRTIWKEYKLMKTKISGAIGLNII